MADQGPSKQRPLSKEAFLANLPEVSEVDLGKWTKEEHFINQVARAPFHRILFNPYRYQGPPGKEFSLFDLYYTLSDPELDWFVQIDKKKLDLSERVIRDPKGIYVLRDELWARVDIDYPYNGYHEREWIEMQIRTHRYSDTVNNSLRVSKSKRQKKLPEETNKKKRTRIRDLLKEDVEDEISERVTAPLPPKVSATSQSVADVDILEVLSKIMGDLRKEVKSQGTKIDKLTESNNAKDVMISDLQLQLSVSVKKNDTAEANSKKSKDLEDQVAKLNARNQDLWSQLVREQGRFFEAAVSRVAAEEELNEVREELRSSREIIGIYEGAQQQVEELKQKKTLL